MKNNLRKYRVESLKLTLRQAAEKLKVSDAELSRWETGKHEPSQLRKREISLIYSVPECWLFPQEGGYEV